MRALALVALAGCAAAAPHDDVEARVAGAGLVRSQPMHDIDVLAKQIGSRLTGTAACDRAEAWAEHELAQAGLANAHRESYALAYAWTPGAFELSAPDPIEAVPLGWTGSTPPDGVEGPLVTVTSETIDQVDARGAILVWTPPRVSPDSFYTLRLERGRLVARAAERGAAAMIIAGQTPRPFASTLHAEPDGPHPATLPVAIVGKSGAERLAQATRARLRAEHQLAKDGHASNVVAEIRGTTRASEVVLLAAHLDSIHSSSGALDDGAGVAAVLGVARALAAAGVRPARTIRFVLFTGEEEGALGSRHYVAAHAGELGAIAAMIQLDSADTKLSGFVTFGRKDVAAALDRATAGLALGTTTSAKEIGSPALVAFSDHGPFVLAGVPAVFASQYAPPEGWPKTQIHSVEDRPEVIDPGAVSANIAILSALVWRLAEADAPLGPRLTPAQIADLVAREHYENDARAMPLPAR